MKKIYFLLLFLSAAGAGFSQMEISAYNATGGGYSTTFLTDYQCIGVNPANLGWTWNNNSMNLGFLETAVGIYSEPLTKSMVINDMFDDGIDLSRAEKDAAAVDFTNTRLWMQGGVTWLGFSYQHDKIGGFAFTIRDRFLWNTKLNQNGAEFLFDGYYAPYFDSLAVQQNGDTIGYSTNPGFAVDVYRGTQMHALWYREYNLGYGRIIMDKKDFKWYGGVAFRYITGYGSYMYNQKGDELLGYTALSPIFEVDYDEPSPSLITEKGLIRVGDGFGFDIGFTFQIIEKIKVGLAVNDIGFINWNGNVYQGNNVLVYQIETSGMSNYNIFAEGQLINADSKPGDPSMWTGLKNKKMSLPMNLRAGGSYRFIPEIEVGFDVYVPLNKDIPGRYEKSMLGIGGHFDPAKWVQLSIGVVTGGNVGTNLPMGVSFFPVRKDNITWQLGFAFRDMITMFKQTNPTVSFAFGFMRFSFGKKPAAMQELPPDAYIETPK